MRRTARAVAGGHREPVADLAFAYMWNGTYWGIAVTSSGATHLVTCTTGPLACSVDDGDSLGISPRLVAMTAIGTQTALVVYGDGTGVFLSSLTDVSGGDPMLASSRLIEASAGVTDVSIDALECEDGPFVAVAIARSGAAQVHYFAVLP